MSELKVHATMAHNERMVHIDVIRREFVARLNKAIDDSGEGDWGAGARLAKITGKTPKAASKWLNAESMPSRANMQAIADGLGVKIEWLQYGVGEMRKSAGVQEPRAYYSIEPILKKVPVISWVTAGAWCESPDPYPPGDAQEWVQCPFEFGEGSFCLRVIGDSMWPEYREGELILVDPTVQALHNDDIVARTTDSRYTFKRLQITPEGSYLLALNPDHPERKIKFPPESHICGVVTGSWQKRK